MTNAELWEREIGRLLREYIAVKRSPKSSAAFQKLQSARVSQWLQEDYLIWKLAYDKR